MYINDNPLSKTFYSRRDKIFDPHEIKFTYPSARLISIFILFFVFQFTNVFGQYQRTITPGRSWKVSGFHYDVNDRLMDSMYVNGTVQLDGNEYSIIADKIQYIGDPQSIAAMREDTVAGKVWVRFFNQDFTPYAPDSILNRDYLVADYSLAIGDTLTYTFIQDAANGFSRCEVHLTVIDTGNVDGRHFVELNTTTYPISGAITSCVINTADYSYYAINHYPLRFYEGIGTSHSPIYPFGGGGVIYPSDPFVTCAYEDGVQIWSDPNVSTCDLPDGWVSDELLSNSSSSKIEIYPNPNDGRFQIQLGDHYVGKSYSLDIHSFDSRIINTQKGRIENSHIECRMPAPSPGLYILNLTVDSEIHILKFIII